LRAGDQDLERVLDPKALSTKSHHDNVVRSSFSPTEDLAVLCDESPARIDMKEKLYLEEFIGYSAIMRNKEGEFDFYGEHSAVKSLEGCAHYTYDAAHNKVFQLALKFGPAGLKQPVLPTEEQYHIMVTKGLTSVPDEYDQLEEVKESVDGDYQDSDFSAMEQVYSQEDWLQDQGCSTREDQINSGQGAAARSDFEGVQEREGNRPVKGS
jgi:hypothetical protein